MGNKLHVVVHTENGTVIDTHTSRHEELILNKLPKDILFKCDIKDLLYCGSIKKHIGNVKHCFFYSVHNSN